MRDVVAAADEQADDWDGVGDVEEDDTGCYHAGGKKDVSGLFLSLWIG